MLTIFDRRTQDAILARIEKLSNNSQAEWGKMNVYQMIEYCILSENMYLQETLYKRLFIGKLFGRMALKGMLKNDAPLKKNEPTHPTFKTTGNGDIAEIKTTWSNLIHEYTHRSTSNFEGFVHPFFGSMTKEQIGQSVYKHTDHHLRQFGV
jgi:hypothetical protein